MDDRKKDIFYKLLNEFAKDLYEFLQERDFGDFDFHLTLKDGVCVNFYTNDKKTRNAKQLDRVDVDFLNKLKDPPIPL